MAFFASMNRGGLLHIGPAKNRATQKSLKFHKIKVSERKIMIDQQNEERLKLILVCFAVSIVIAFITFVCSVACNHRLAKIETWISKQQDE